MPSQRWDMKSQCETRISRSFQLCSVGSLLPLLLSSAIPTLRPPSPTYASVLPRPAKLYEELRASSERAESRRVNDCVVLPPLPGAPVSSRQVKIAFSPKGGLRQRQYTRRFAPPSTALSKDEEVSSILATPPPNTCGCCSNAVLTNGELLDGGSYVHLCDGEVVRLCEGRIRPVY